MRNWKKYKNKALMIRNLCHFDGEISYSFWFVPNEMKSHAKCDEASSQMK